MSINIKLTLLYLVLVVLFIFFGTQLARRHGSDIRLVSYLSALSFTVTCVVTSIASSLGAIDPSGKFVGSAGKQIQALINFTLDLPTDLKLVGAIVAIVLLPQIISYVVSGLFGCANSPLFIGVTLKVAFWLCVKPFITAGGVMFAVAVYGLTHGWTDMSFVKSAILAWFGFALVMVALTYIFFYRGVPTDLQLPKGLGWIKSIDNFFRRSERTSA